VLGRSVRFVEMPLDQIEKQSKEMADMFRWFNEQGYDANIQSLRDIYPPLTSFASWLRKVNWAALAHVA
jgi:hypothetical protein